MENKRKRVLSSEQKVARAVYKLKWLAKHPDYFKKWRKAHPDYEKWRSKTPKRIVWKQKSVDSGKSAEYARKYHQKEKSKEINREYLRRMTKERPLVVAARWKVRNALRVGKLVKPNRCSQCGSISERLHAHHFDYTRPLDVTWLCHWCHMAIHASQK